MRRTDGTVDHPAARKSALFCQECAHVSPVDGDWYVHEGTHRTVYVCPDCGTVIEDRPIFDGGPDASDSQRCDSQVTIRLPTVALGRALALLHF